jgi:hypothetical protein
MYTTADPHAFLNTRYYNTTRCNNKFPIYPGASPGFLHTSPHNEISCYEAPRRPERFRFSLSGFRQSADFGNDIHRNPVMLGDLLGPWNMLALLYPEKDGNTDIQTLLRNTLQLIATPDDVACFELINNPLNTDPTQQFGFFSVPISYRKFGARFEAEFGFGDFGLIVQGGVADLRQTATFLDLTCTATGLSCPVRDCVPVVVDCPSSVSSTACITENCCIDVFNCACKTLVIQNIMDQVELVADTLGQSICNYHETGAEDTRLMLFWRRTFEINKDRPTWAFFTMTPFFVAGVNAPTGKKQKPSELFSLPNGNNGHWGIGFEGGFSINFLETIEVDFEIGFTEFLKKCHSNVPVPTSHFQNGIMPRKATLEVKPGTNWVFGATMAANNFLDRLSFYVQYLIITHGEDCIRVVSTNDPNINNIDVCKLICDSKWYNQIVNVSFNYDISPNVALGFLWQAPVKRRNAYRSTTVLGSLVVTF